MQYIFLRGIIESTIKNFVCPQCQNKTTEQSLFLTGVTSQGVDVNVHCHVCQANTLLHAEINTNAQQMMNSEQGQTLLKELIDKGGTLGADFESGKKSEHTIKDEDITTVYKNLKNAHTVEDILSGEE